MRRNTLLIAILASAVGTGAVCAQPADDRRPPVAPDANCPPDVKGDPPTIGRGGGDSLSDRLAESKGIICPPAGIDREMQVAPPGGGELKVIPPPGSPGGDPNVQPK